MIDEEKEDFGLLLLIQQNNLEDEVSEADVFNLLEE